MKRILLVTMLTFSASVGAANFDQTYEGKYSWGPEVESFTLCNSETSYWVSFAWAGIEMHEFYKKRRIEPYQFMYLKFRGHLLDEAVQGFAESYDGFIRISEVKEFSFELPTKCE